AEGADPTHRDEAAMNGAPCICAKRVSPSAKESDAHGHEDVAVLDVFGAVFGAHLAGGLGVLELQADLAGGADGLEEVDEVLAVEADDERVVVVRSLDGVLDSPESVEELESLSSFCS